MSAQRNSASHVFEPLEVAARPIEFGRYLLLRQIGEGGMGSVYEAYDPGLGRRVAIKVFRNPVDQQGSRSVSSKAARATLVAEARALARLNHQAIVPIYDFGDVNGRVYVAMQYLQGQTLRKWIEQASRPWQEVVGIYQELARGLDAIHQAQLVHRDFKPDNVMVGDDGKATIVDFGLAIDEFESWAVSSAVPTRSVTSPVTDGSAAPKGNKRVSGTIAYMPPEQHQELAATAATDQYTFCVALFESLFGHRPFVGPAPEEYLLQKMRMEICWPDGRNGVPRHIVDVLRRGLSAEPHCRYPDMQALLADLVVQPARGRVRVLGIVVLCVLAVFAVLSYFSRANQAREACDAHAERSRGIWSTEIADQVETSFHATHSPRAYEIFQSVARHFRSLRGEWQEVALEVCVDKLEIYTTRKSASLEEQSRCLEDRLADIQDVLKLLKSVDADSLARAPGLVLEIPFARSCRDAAAYFLFLPTPSEERRASQVGAARRELRRLSNAQALGVYDYHGDAADSLLHRATQIGYPPFVAEASHFKARIDLHGTKTTTVGLDLQRAILLGELGQLDHVQVDTLSLFLFLRGYREAKTHEAMEMMRHAIAHAKRVDAPPQMIGDIYVRMMAVFAAASRWRDAENYGHLALTAYAASTLSFRPNLMTVYNNLGVVQFGLGHYEAAQENFSAAQREAIANLGPDHPDILYSTGNLALAAACIGDLDASNRAADAAADLVKRSGSLPIEPLIRARFQLAENLSLRGARQQALAVLQRSVLDYEVIGARDDPYSFEAWSRIALVEAARGDDAAARKAADTTLALLQRAEASGKPARESEFGYAALAYVYEKLGDDKAADKMEALAWPRLLSFAADEPTPVDFVYLKRAARLQREGDFAAARRALTDAVHAPKIPAYRLWEIRLQRAGVHIKLGDVAAAQEDLAWIEKSSEGLVGPRHLGYVRVLEVRAELANLQGDPLSRDQALQLAKAQHQKFPKWQEDLSPHEIEFLMHEPASR